MRFLFRILCGIIQGCPLSGSLFVIALNPFLNCFETLLGTGEIMRAFADDLGAVFRDVMSEAKKSWRFSVSS